jgi:hypothetical protein
MAEMPRPDTSRRKRVTDYALGIVHESLWILGMTLAAFLFAVLAMAVTR